MEKNLADRILLRLLQTPEMDKAFCDYAYGQDSKVLSEYLRETVPAEQLFECLTPETIAEYAVTRCRSELISYIKDNASFTDCAVEEILDILMP